MPGYPITLASGRVIQLHELRQWEVYEGLLEGLPTREGNARKIASIVAAAQGPQGAIPYLITPTETPLTYHGGRYPFGDPAALPEIACVARFGSSFGTRREDPDRLYASSLTVVWFQTTFALPIEPGVLETIRTLDWNHLARAYEI